MTRLLKWAAYVAVLASALYFAFLAGTPFGVMHLIKSRMASLGGDGVNTMHHGERPSHTSRGVVRPSPELLYSVCWFDLSKGPVHIVSGAPQGTYWSVAFYRDNTDNFYVINDTATKGAKADLLLYPEGLDGLDKAAYEAKYNLPGNPDLMASIGVSSPSATGLVLIRTLINDEARLPEIDGERRQARCGPVTP